MRQNLGTLHNIHNFGIFPIEKNTDVTVIPITILELVFFSNNSTILGREQQQGLVGTASDIPTSATGFEC